MKCTKTMLHAAAALGLAAVVSYFAFPEAKLFILANASLLVALICPVSMLIMMWSMRGHQIQADKTTTSSENQQPLRTVEVSRENAS